MRLLPNSLFGRLVVVMLGGLLLAQLASVYINLTERNQLLYQAGGMRLAQKISDISKLLDSLPGSERQRVVAVFNAPPLVVSLGRAALGQTRTGENDFQVSMFTSLLRYDLGDETPVNVAQLERTPESFGSAARPGPPGMRMKPGQMAGRGLRDAPPGGTFFTVQTMLRDGTWVTFDSHLSPQASAVPLRVGLTLLILLGTVILLSLIAVRWATGPLSALATAAEKLGEDINRPPLAETGPLEVRRAAKAFNTMQLKLSRFISERTRMLTAMSHDLKTPITRLRLRAALLDDEALRAKLEKDIQEMETMVLQTLDFMRNTNAAEPLQPVDMMALLESLKADYADSGNTVEIKGSAGPALTGRPLGLRRCLTNLLDNAIRYGHRATITLEDGTDVLTVRIRDAGPGLPENQLEQVFEPFFRGEASRSRDTGGTGLGLGIARNIARAHGGDLVLKNHSHGGLEAILLLPRAH